MEVNVRYPNERFYVRFMTIFAITLSLFAKPAVAQTGSEEGKVRLEEMTVTATKSERPTIDTPEAVNIITREDIERQQAQDIGDLFRYEPGVDIDGTFGGSLRERPMIRGLSGNRVLINVDGSRLNFSRAHKGNLNFIDVDSVERVEIIRGPASALYGSNALGGVISIVTKDPEDFLEPGESFGGRLKFGYNSVNSEAAEGFTFYGTAGEQFSYLFAYTRRDADNIDTPAGEISGTGLERDNFDFKGVFRPTDKGRIRVNLQYLDDMSEFPFAPSNAFQSREREDETNRTLLGVGYERSDPNSVVSSLDLNAYAHLTEIEEGQHLECFASSCASAPLAAFVRKIRDQVDEFDFDTYGAEVRGTTSLGSSDQGLLLTYGIEYYRDDAEQLRTRNETTFASAGAAGVVQPAKVTASVPDATADTYAFYLQGEVSILDRVTLIPGIRWDIWDLEAAVNTAGFNNGSGLLTDQNKDQDDDKVNPKIGFVVELMDNLNLTGNYSQGFRSPAFQELFLSSPHRPGREFTPNPNLKPEESENYDIGLKGSSEQVHFSLNYFYNRVDDFIGFKVVNFQGNPTCSPSFLPPFPSNCQEAAVNIQEATIEGVEASFDYTITSEILFYGNYTRTRGTDNLNNEPLTDISPEKGLAGFLLENECNLSWCQKFYVDLRGRFVGRPDRIAPGEAETGGYSVYDIRAGVDMSDSFRASAAIENLTDKEYQEFLSGGLTAEGINVAVNLRYRF